MLVKWLFQMKCCWQRYLYSWLFHRRNLSNEGSLTVIIYFYLASGMELVFSTCYVNVILKYTVSWMTWMKYIGIVDDIPRNLFSTHFQFNITPRPLHSVSTWFDWVIVGDERKQVPGRRPILREGRMRIKLYNYKYKFNILLSSSRYLSTISSTVKMTVLMNISRAQLNAT